MARRCTDSCSCRRPGLGGRWCEARRGGAGANRGARKPAVVFAHGGPPRQMLLGWHYRFYYANSYALNQYLASRGFVVLSVNFRLGIGYGYDFHQPRDGGIRGASEYQDVLAAGKYLQARADVDPARVGIWGGSYGGYLVGARARPQLRRVRGGRRHPRRAQPAVHAVGGSADRRRR